ncbi:MAG: hypothetical protein L0Y68_08635 [Candidatus Dadabacteria bacterium]|nr:hypothetical protein [Candidatus Dadabacteria bacterium]
MLKVSYFREISKEREEEFFQKGYKKRYFFTHRIYYIPKCGPDGFKLSNRMCGEDDPNKHWMVVLYASAPLIDQFPAELFFDDDIIWHQQQFGKIGQLATANLVVDGVNLYTMVHISDLVQRISRRKEYKTRIENWFKGWPHMLLNSIMNFAVENSIKQIYSPTAGLALEHTDPSRNVQRELFERIYDRVVNKHFLVTKEGKWWVIDVAKNKDRIIITQKKQEVIESEKTICLCHDIERGLGHIDVDPNFADLANKTSPGKLDEMLVIEKEMDVKATYNVVGCFFNEVRRGIEKDGHCIAFHSYDHIIHGNQLAKCRQIDYRIKGYRAPQSKITPDLSDENLCHHNFEWLASSANSLGIKSPVIKNRIVKIPILLDDFDLYKSKMKYEDWEKKAIQIIEQNDFVAFGLHDCYAQYWLPHYREFLKKFRGLGKLKTLNEVANEVFLSNSI